MTEEQRVRARARCREWRRKRIETDPSFIEAEREKRRRYYQRHRERLIALKRGKRAKRTKAGLERHMQRIREWLRNKRANDAEYRRRENAATARRHREFRRQNPELVKLRDQIARDRRNPGLALRRAIRSFERGDITIDAVLEQGRKALDQVDGKLKRCLGDNWDSGCPVKDGERRGKNG